MLTLTLSSYFEIDYIKISVLNFGITARNRHSSFAVYFFSQISFVIYENGALSQNTCTSRHKQMKTSFQLSHFMMIQLFSIFSSM